MTHYISVSIEQGTSACDAMRVPLNEVVGYFPTLARTNKTDNTLLFGVYLDLPNNYERKGLEEHPGARINTLFIDCDNGEKELPHTWDRNIIEKFRADMKDYCYIIWETFSSTPERPKFRALIPLDKTIQYNKFIKRAVVDVFADYADKQATWYFAPDAEHISTVEFHMGDDLKLFSADTLVRIANKKQSEQNFRNWDWQIRNACQGCSNQNTPDGWRQLKLVKKCLEGLMEGERDKTLNAACFLLWKLGYQEHIREFLDCVDLPMSIKKKFYNKKYNI